jgi:hypothetical protein
MPVDVGIEITRGVQGDQSLLMKCHEIGISPVESVLSSSNKLGDMSAKPFSGA